MSHLPAGVDLQVSVEHLISGQSGNYKPHTYRSRITLEGRKVWNVHNSDDRWREHDEAKVRELARQLVHHFTDDPVIPGDMGSHFRPRLKVCELESCTPAPSTAPFPGWRQVWVVQIEEPFCD